MLLARLQHTACIAMLACCTDACAQLTIEQANDTDGILSASLSPNGKYVVAIGYAGITTGVMLIDVENMSVKTIRQSKVESYSRRDPDGVVQYFNHLKEPLLAAWLSNDLIAVDFDDAAETINLTGKTVAEIGTGLYRKTAATQDGAPLVLVYTDDRQTKIGLANARSGEITAINVPLSGTPESWVFDKNGGLRAVSMINSALWKDATTLTHWYRTGTSAPWEKLAEFKVTDNYWIPQAVTERPDTLVVASSMDRDTMAVYNYDTVKREFGELLVGHPTEDVLRAEGNIEKTLDGVATNGMVPHKYWFNPVWRDLQIQVDSVLPKRVNVLTGDPERRVLVRSSSDTDPGTWLILDVKAMTLTPLGRVQSSIEPEKMQPMRMLSYPSFDGLTIPAYLTLPPGGKAPGPMVVMIHGGPAARDTWSWDPDVQLLAAHGYIVFQPQFRGSAGFGRKFELAGLGQWGLAMQDDITAGVEYLIKLGIADRNRICIYGASYGGYAALWGLVKTPNLYKCGISFAGVTDIAYMLNDWSDRNDSTIARQYQQTMHGNSEQERERYDRVSPLKHADQIKAPVLIMHGTDDQRVPLAHAEKMRAVLKALDKPFELEYFAGEGHGISYVSNANKFYKHLFAFLDKYIGQQTPGPAEPERYDSKPDPKKRYAERRRIYMKSPSY